MSGENSRFTSDRWGSGESSWVSEADWVAGTAENVDIANGRLVGQVPNPSSQIPDDGMLYTVGANEDSWVEGGTEADWGEGTLADVEVVNDQVVARPLMPPGEVPDASKLATHYVASQLSTANSWGVY